MLLLSVIHCCGLIVLHCCAVWKNLLHHWFEHLDALHCSVVCLDGLSDLHVLHKAVLFVFFCVCVCGLLVVF